MSTLLGSPLVERALAAGRPEVTGRVVRVVGLTFEIEGLPAAIGDMVRLGDPSSGDGVLGEIVALGEQGTVRGNETLHQPGEAAPQRVCRDTGSGKGL